MKIKELSKNIAQQLDAACERGNALMDEANYAAAYQVFESALALLPPPAENWAAASWLWVSMGDALFGQADYENALALFLDAGRCGEYANPFVNLRAGQCFYQLKVFEFATEYLLRAYLFEGATIFKNQEPIYLEWLGTQVKL
jgi:tetratricopeptide (TPR) repeat protein